MNWFFFAVVLPLVLLFVGLVVCSVHWAVTHGQGAALWRSVRSLFDREPRPTAPDETPASDSARASQF